MQAMLAGELPFPHIAETLDFSLVEIGPGKAVFQGTPQLKHYNPLGTVHGGWYATLLDSALGCARAYHDAGRPHLHHGRVERQHRAGGIAQNRATAGDRNSHSLRPATGPRPKPALSGRTASCMPMRPPPAWCSRCRRHNRHEQQTEARSGLSGPAGWHRLGSGPDPHAGSPAPQPASI